MPKAIIRLINMDVVVRIRGAIASIRGVIDPVYCYRQWKRRKLIVVTNAPYESGVAGYWYPDIMGIKETLQYIKDHHVSVTRFGDGEFEIVAKRISGVSFQGFDDRLRNRLLEVLMHPVPQCLTCIINVFGSLERFVDEDARFWRETLLWLRPVVKGVLEESPQLIGDPQISRPYMPMRDKGAAKDAFAMWKEIFKGQEIVIVEGRYSRLGVGNDLFAGAKSVARIWCPHVNAFDSYDGIVQTVMTQVGRDKLILLALGQTATVMAYDLAKSGYWTLDVGHLDVEYMWMKMGAKTKVAIPGRYVNEAQDGHEMISKENEEVECNVIAKVGC